MTLVGVPNNTARNPFPIPPHYSSSSGRAVENWLRTSACVPQARSGELFFFFLCFLFLPGYRCALRRSQGLALERITHGMNSHARTMRLCHRDTEPPAKNASPTRPMVPNRELPYQTRPPHPAPRPLRPPASSSGEPHCPRALVPAPSRRRTHSSNPVGPIEGGAANPHLPW